MSIKYLFIDWSYLLRLQCIETDILDEYLQIKINWSRDSIYAERIKKDFISGRAWKTSKSTFFPTSHIFKKIEYPF